MKIRTKLILLLSAALVVTMLVSTWLRIDWTRRRLEEQLKQSAQDTAVLIANELSQRLQLGDGSGRDRRAAQGRAAAPSRRRSRARALDTDEDTVSSFALAQSMEDAKVDKKPRQVAKKSPLQRREEARRAYYDHGESTRRPGARMVEAMWRTPDKPDPGERWPPSHGADAAAQADASPSRSRARRATSSSRPRRMSIRSGR